MALWRDAVNALDPVKSEKNERTLLLDVLTELCASKVAAFTNSVEEDLRSAGTAENKTIPVTEVIARHSEYRAYSSKDVGKVPGEIASAVKDFITGGSDSIVEGVAKLVTTALTAILGKSTALQQETSTYYIVVQDYAIARYDLRAWSRYIEAQGIVEEIENALAIVAYKSSVDVSKISFNTFLMAYSNQLKMMGFDGSQIKEYLDAAWQVFSDLRKDASPAGLATSAAPLALGSVGGVAFTPPGHVLTRTY
jgi:hypothetical protein